MQKYPIYKTSPGTYTDPAYPAGKYAQVYLLSNGLEVLTLQILDGKIIRYDYHLGRLTEADLEEKAQEFILPLSFNPIPTAVAWNQFSDPEGRFSFLYSPVWHILPGEYKESWILENQIQIEILDPDNSWITCFDQALGDCPFVDSDFYLVINNTGVRRLTGYLGAVGGNTPQEFMSYIFPLERQALVFTIYALPIGTQVSDSTQIWPLEGIELELFQRTVETVQLSK